LGCGILRFDEIQRFSGEFERTLRLRSFELL
jgi:hypothetical protein